MNLLSVFGGGLWIIPIGLFLGAAYSAYRGYRSSKSGSTYQNPDGTTSSSNINVPFYKTGGGVFSIILTLALIAVIILMVNDK